MLEQGPIEQKIIDQCIREKLPLPDRIQNAPEMTWGLELFYLAWRELDTMRPVAMAEGAIPWSAVLDFAIAHDIDGDLREELCYQVRALDNAYLKWRAEKRDAERRKAESGSKRKR